MANPKIFTFRETAEHTDFNELIDDVRKDYICHGSGAGVSQDAEGTFRFNTTATSKPGSPDFIFPIHVATGQYLNIAIRLNPTVSGTVEFILAGSGGDDQHSIDTRTSDEDVFLAKDITGLTNNGDLRGEAFNLEVFLWGTSGQQDLYIHWIRSSNILTASFNWFL